MICFYEPFPICIYYVSVFYKPGPEKPYRQGYDINLFRQDNTVSVCSIGPWCRLIWLVKGLKARTELCQAQLNKPTEWFLETDTFYCPITQYLSGVVLSDMVLFGPLWSSIVPYGPLWSYMVPYGPLWSSKVPYVPLWSSRVLYGPLWSSMVIYGPI